MCYCFLGSSNCLDFFFQMLIWFKGQDEKHHLVTVLPVASKGHLPWSTFRYSSFKLIISLTLSPFGLFSLSDFVLAERQCVHGHTGVFNSQL